MRSKRNEVNVPEKNRKSALEISVLAKGGGIAQAQDMHGAVQGTSQCQAAAAAVRAALTEPQRAIGSRLRRDAERNGSGRERN